MSDFVFVEEELLSDCSVVLRPNPLGSGGASRHRKCQEVRRDGISHPPAVKFEHLVIEVADAGLEQADVNLLVLLNYKVGACVSEPYDVLEVLSEWVLVICEDRCDAAF